MWGGRGGGVDEAKAGKGADVGFLEKVGPPAGLGRGEVVPVVYVEWVVIGSEGEGDIGLKPGDVVEDVGKEVDSGKGFAGGLVGGCEVMDGEKQGDEVGRCMAKAGEVA